VGSQAHGALHNVCPTNVDQVLGASRFHVEWTEIEQPAAPVTWERWSMYFNDSFTLNGVGGGIVLISHKGD
jgi:hypothetical protein